MTDSNYCHNLWGQLTKVKEAQENCSTVLALANEHSSEHFTELAESLNYLQDRLWSLDETWQKAFIEHNGFHIFKLDYDILVKIGEQIPSNIKKPLDELEKDSIQDGRVAKLNIFHTYIPDKDEVCRLISSLPELQELRLKKTDISDLTFLSGLQKLKIIELDQIKDFEMIVKFGNLEVVSLVVSSGISVSPLSKLKKMKHLTLDICDTEVDFSSLAGAFTELEAIGINSNLSSDQLHDLFNSGKVEGLYLSISDYFCGMEALEGNQNLKRIVINKCNPTEGKIDLSVLPKIPNIERVAITESKVSNIQSLMDLPTDCWIWLHKMNLDEFDNDLLESLKSRGVIID